MTSDSKFRRWLLSPLLDAFGPALDQLARQNAQLRERLDELSERLDDSLDAAAQSRLAIGTLHWNMLESHRDQLESQRNLLESRWKEFEQFRAQQQEWHDAQRDRADAIQAASRGIQASLERLEDSHALLRNSMDGVGTAVVGFESRIQEAQAGLARTLSELIALARASDQLCEARAKLDEAFRGKAQGLLQELRASLDAGRQEQVEGQRMLGEGQRELAAGSQARGEAIREAHRTLAAEQDALGVLMRMQHEEVFRFGREANVRLETQSRRLLDETQLLSAELERLLGLHAQSGQQLEASLRTSSERQEIILAKQGEFSQRIQDVAKEGLLEIRDAREQVGAQLQAFAKDGEQRHAQLVAGRADMAAPLKHLDKGQEALAVAMRDLAKAFAEIRGDVAVSDEAAAEREGRLSRTLDTVLEYSYASARRVAIPCGQGQLLVRTAAGYLICDENDSSLLAGLVESGDLEPGTRILIERILEPGKVFIDVGANVGMHTLAAARALRGRGHIVAYEPHPTTAAHLARTVELNGLSRLVEVRQAALADKAGFRQLHLGRTSGHHSLYPLDAAVASTEAPLRVPAETLDQLGSKAGAVDLIKIDAEGAELDVIKGAKSLVARSPDVALIVEFGISHLRRRRLTTKQWLGKFQTLGLDFRAIEAHTGRLEKWSIKQLESVESVNLFFAKPRSKAWAEQGQERG